MIHAFECLNRFFALDVESGSFFEIDKPTYTVLSGGDLSQFSPATLNEVNAELSDLRAQKILDTPEVAHNKLQYSPVIKAMCLNVSHNCNLACEYCFAAQGTYNDVRRNMSLEVAIKAIDFLVANSADRHNLEVDFFGGEPMLNLDTVKQTVLYARSIEDKSNKKFRFTLTTNAMKISDKDIEFFNEQMHNVVISIDGRESVHNRVRKSRAGTDSYQTVIRNALNFKAKRKGMYYVRGTFTAYNLDFSNDVLYLNDLGFDQLSIEPVVLPDNSPMAIKEEHYPIIATEYEKLAGEYIKRRKTDKWFNFFHFMMDLENSPCESKRIKGCGAGSEYVVVAPDGGIYPCHQFDGENQFLLGNVFDGKLNEQLRKQFFDCSILTKPECSACWAKYNCSGGCMANAYHANKTINQPYKGACFMMKKRLECALAIKAIESSISEKPVTN